MSPEPQKERRKRSGLKKGSQRKDGLTLAVFWQE